MAASCVQCHTEGGEFPDLTSEELIIAEIGSVKERVEIGNMPPVKFPKFAISEAQRKLLLDWIAKVQTVNPVEPNPVEPIPPVVVPPVPPEAKFLTDEEVALLKDNELNYALVNKNAFEQSCLGCHSETSSKPRKPLLDSYAKIVENKQAVQDAVQSEDMPPKGMVDVRRQLILKWLNLGAPLEIVPEEVNPPRVIEEKVLFSQVSEKVFVPHCIRCHGEGEDFDLTLLEDAKANAISIKEQVVTKAMPKGKNNKLSDEQINLVVKWVDQGAN
jgi:mono/diheme cytochrome c family protein